METPGGAVSPAPDSRRLILWAPVAMMAGIGLYFRLADEPPALAGPLALAVFLALLMVTRRWARLPALALCFAALGFSAAQVRTFSMATPLIAEELRFRAIEGDVEAIEPVEKKVKLVLTRLSIEGLPPEHTPASVRVSFRSAGEGVRVGDRLRFTGNLYPLPSPTMPGGYDFARHFYFRGIGGNGFALRTPERVEVAEESGWRARLGNLRHDIGEDMRAYMDAEAGTVAAAMTIGEMGPIPEDTKEHLRNSGLAHMLSISGLHLAIAAGVVFFAVRLLLALPAPLALRLPIKKIAAVFALAGAFAYFLLAGYPVPAQRAFIMVALVFLAMLLDRSGITLRSLALAAIVVLLVFPEAMMGPSFQMSFAATLAIVSLYERFGPALKRPHAAWWQRPFYQALGIAATSLAATLATTPYVLYHFNRFALFGLVANMAVIPLATFVIMPGVVLSLLLMPLGLQWVGYAPLEWGTRMMLSMSAWVTDLPYASVALPSPNDAGLILCTFGLLWLCLAGRRALLGLPLMAAGLATAALHVPVDVMVGEQGRQVMARLEDGRYTLLKGTERAFAVQSWLRSEGQDGAVKLKESGLDCDKARCLYRREGVTLVHVKTPRDGAALAAACEAKPEILVAWWYLHADRCPGPRLLLGRRELETHGAHALRFKNGAVEVTHTRDDALSRRPWQPARAQEEE